MTEFFASELWTGYLWPLIIIAAQSVLLLVVLLVAIAYILLADRKIWAAVQMRRGPNVVGPWGLLQSFADLLKFVFKEVVIPDGANKGVFLLAPVVSAVLAISAWAVIPVADGWAIANVNVGILYVFAISSLEVYGVIMGGWASNSKYPFLGALRSAAQMVSYEVSMGFVIVTVLLCVGSLNLNAIVKEVEMLSRTACVGGEPVVVFVKQKPTSARFSIQNTSVVVKTPDAKLDERAVKTYALANAPAYQHPRRVIFVEEMPLAGTNKIDKRALAQQIPTGEI